MENAQNKIHQENRALGLHSGYLLSMAAILIFLHEPSGIMSRWLLWPLLPHLVLKSQGYWSLHKGTGFSRGLDVWPRNPFSRNFPREKTCRSLEKPCEAWPAPRPLWAAFLSHLLCRLVMFHSLFPEQRQFKCKGQLCSA